MEFLNQSWGYVVGAIGVITLLWNFKKLVKDIKTDISKPFTDMNTKIDNLSKDLNEKVDKLSDKIDVVQDNDAMTRRALLTMQRNSLLRSCEDFIGRGFATMNEKETISSQYESYHELGGDSFVTDLVNQVIDLPLKKQIPADTNK